MEQKEQQYEIILLNLYCYMVEEDGFDDIYLKFNGKKFWPINGKKMGIAADTVTTLDIKLGEFSPGEPIKIELWDWDLLSADDFYGDFSFVFEGDEGSFSTDLQQNTRKTRRARYRLEWEAFPVPSFK
ncbi:MAG TPA: hypothetical protein DDY13_04205 [Cytophagales bacterium]|jgi:hypothetical protein|nr:hypothetical protein [Cytophagales bacterium]